MKLQVLDGYRYFFPAGWALGVWGVLLWLLFPQNLVGYPGLLHPEIMMGGFLLCFVCGFLMTAVPRFTASFGPTSWEQNLALILILLLFVSLFLPGKVYFYIVDLFLFLFLIQFLYRRFRVRKANLPDAFIFVGFGLFAGTLGSLILLSREFWNEPASLYVLGRLLFLQAYILALVIGVGSRLIPALLGWAPLPTEGRPLTEIKVFVGLAGVFFASYVVEIFDYIQFANVLRALVISAIGMAFWHLLKLPKRRERHAFLIWTSAWCLTLGQWGVAFFPAYRIHVLHVVFIAGLALMTLMIATRVGLSHGHHDMGLEKSSKALLLGALLIIFSALTRLSAGFAPEIYQSHLVYAAGSWLLGLFVWGVIFLPKILRVRAS